MSMITELKPCPFCGGEAKIFAYNEGGICVKCMECLCQTQAVTDGSVAMCKQGNAFELVIKAWNRRAE